jgi:hypothetical protein
MLMNEVTKTKFLQTRQLQREGIRYEIAVAMGMHADYREAIVWRGKCYQKAIVMRKRLL